MADASDGSSSSVERGHFGTPRLVRKTALDATSASNRDESNQREPGPRRIRRFARRLSHQTTSCGLAGKLLQSAASQHGHPLLQGSISLMHALVTTRCIDRVAREEPRCR
jgi:hypothetical protein